MRRLARTKNVLSLKEAYRSGHNGTVSKTVCLARGTRVRIPPLPPYIFMCRFRCGVEKNRLPRKGAECSNPTLSARMTILTDHLNIDKRADAGYWYVWSLDFRNTFLVAYDSFFTKEFSLEKPVPGSISLWHLYAHAIELYLKTYLLAKKRLTVKELAKKEWGHNLENLRKLCSGYDSAFNSQKLLWVTQDLGRFMNGLFWENIKYPNKRLPLKNKYLEKGSTHLPPLYGREEMVEPLVLLDGLVKPLVYVDD